MKTMAAQPQSVFDDGRRDALAERLLSATSATMDVYSHYIGNKLGFYRALAERATTAAELAVRTGTHERYAREWLEQQAVHRHPGRR